MPDGTQNNLTGMALEGEVLAKFRRHGFNGRTRYTLPDHVGLAPHGTRTTVSVWIEPCTSFPRGLGIDASSAANSGTAYQKVPFKVINAGSWNCPGLVVIDGDGRGMVKMRSWAAEEFVKTYPGCLGVFTLSQLERWLSKTKELDIVHPGLGKTESVIQGSLI